MTLIWDVIYFSFDEAHGPVTVHPDEEGIRGKGGKGTKGGVQGRGALKC